MKIIAETKNLIRKIKKRLKKKPQLYETLIFWNEDHFFAERIRCSLQYADHLVISEFDTSFSRKDYRPFKVKGLLKRHGIKSSRISVLELHCSETEPWAREHFLRNSGYAFLRENKKLRSEDVILIQDFDEWLTPRFAKPIMDSFEKDSLPLLHLPYACTYYYLNYLVKRPESHDPWPYPVAVTHGYFEASKELPSEMRLKYLNLRFPEKCGWHHSYLGDLKFILNKIESFSHFSDPGIGDIPPEKIEKLFRDAQDIFGREFLFERIDYSVSGIPALQNRKDLLLD